jgi:hypothetical protein
MVAHWRKYPRFLDEWKLANGGHFAPSSYLSVPEGIEFVIASQWLYVPDFFEYRGGVFVSGLPQGLTDERRIGLDKMFLDFGGRVASVESLANLLEFWLIFGMSDIEAYYDEIEQTARSVRESWEALLKARYPTREFNVYFRNDDPDVGPLVSFHTVEPV